MQTPTIDRRQNLTLHFFCSLAAASLFLLPGARAQELRVTELRCDGLPQSLAVSSPHPRLSWQLQAGEGERGVMQDHVRVVVSEKQADAARGIGRVWDSGDRAQDEPAMEMESALRPATAYWWSVRAWDQHGKTSGWATPARFTTTEKGWQAAWIQAPFSTERDGAELDGSHPMPIFRRSFTLRGQPVEAYLSIAGLGQYEAHLNGARVGNIALGQAWTDYRKTVTYDTYDVTTQLHRGVNLIHVLLGNGMYNVQRTPDRYTKFVGTFGVPKLTAELRVRYANGQSETFVTDASWRAAKGPILFSSTYGGEDDDARRWSEVMGSKADSSTQGWQAVTLAQPPGGIVIPAIAPPVVEHEHYTGVLIANQPTTAAAGTQASVYDFGQNSAGWPRIVVHGAAGSVVRLIPGELLNRDGTVSQRSSKGPQWWAYTLSGSGSEVWQPHFSYYGFRYLQVEWTSGNGTVDEVESIAVHSASEPAGDFASSSDMLNRIHHLILAAMHNNEVSLFTDCPHREKLGWLEQTHLVAPGLLYNDNLAALYRMTERNIADAQGTDGLVPTIAPQYVHFGPKHPVFDDSPEWGSAAILAPWAVYRQTGDMATLQDAYPVMQGYLRYLHGRAHNGVVNYGLGDWYDIGPNPPGMSQDTSLGVTATMMLYEDAKAMARIATLLGKADDAASDSRIAAEVQAGFQARFFHADTGVYDTGSQTANAMPLALGVVPKELQAEVLRHIVDDIHRHNDHITTGEVGFPYLVRALLQSGRSDVLLSLLLRTDAPSYGSQLAAGATSLTEAWDANPHSSQDHFMLGGGEEWLYRGLAGLDIDFARPDMAARITLRPIVLQGVTWARASYRSRYGVIRNEWHVNDGALTMDVTVPAGTMATVVVPASANTAVLENGRSIDGDAGVTFMRREAGDVVLKVGSGTYRFTSQLPGN